LWGSYKRIYGMDALFCKKVIEFFVETV